MSTDLKISLCSNMHDQKGSVNILDWTMFTGVQWEVRKYPGFFSQMLLRAADKENSSVLYNNLPSCMSGCFLFYLIT